MSQATTTAPAYVIKAEELAILNYLTPDHPRPQQVEWINRGTDQKLKRSSVDMLMRTLFRDVASPSVVKLHRSAGLRAVFRSDRERDTFAAAFAAARKRDSMSSRFLVTAIFDDREHAERAVSDLKQAGIPDKAISLLWRASQFMDTDVAWQQGASTLSVAGAVAGGGVAGAMLGVAILAIPGLGPVAAAGAIAAHAFSSVATVSGVIGAAGGAVARMLTDHDVDGVSASYYEQQIRRGKVFLSVDTSKMEDRRDEVRQILRQAGGRTSNRN